MIPVLSPFVAAIVRVLTRLLPRDRADDMIGDLLEHYARRRRWRRVWLVGQAISLCCGLLGAVERTRRPAAVAFDVWRADLRHARRGLSRARGFTAIALLSVALGIGLTTAVFSVVDGMMVRPLPYGDPDAIVKMRQSTPARRPGSDAVERAVLYAVHTRSRTVASVAPYSTTDVRIVTSAGPLVSIKVAVSERFFDVMRTVPAIGRLLQPADSVPGAPPVAVVTHGFWESALGRDPGVVGRPLVVEDVTYQVVGVLPASFAYPSTGVALYVPGRWWFPEASTGGSRAFVGPTIDVVARLKPGATTADAARELTLLDLQRRRAPGGVVAPVFDVSHLQDALVKDVRPALLLLTASVGCVLAIVCVNLANLLLTRGTARQREMAVRAALGASRWDVARALSLEGMLLALLGGVGGVAVAALLIAAAPLSASIDPLLAAQVRIDGRVMTFALLVSVVVGVVVGMLPALQIPATNVTIAIAGGPMRWLPGASIRGERARNILVVLQVALAIVLAVSAALLSRSLVRLLNVDVGFRPEGALSLQVRLPPRSGLAYDWRARFYEDFVDALVRNPAVQAAGFSTSLPTDDTISRVPVHIEGASPPEGGIEPRAHREVITPGYLPALGVPIVTGRGLLPTDTASSEPVLLVNEVFAAAFLDGRHPVGARAMLFGRWFRVVGVVRSKRHTGLTAEPRPELYVALSQAPPDIVTTPAAGVVLRVTGPPARILPFVRSTLRTVQPDAAIEKEGALADRLWASTAQPRFYATVMSVFAILALLTAMIGLFAVLAYVVERRRREIGVRRALGATGRDISGIVVRHGLKLVGIAAPLGIAGAFAGNGLLRRWLFGVEPADPVAFATVLIVITAAALAACAVPAVRALTIEPLEALREE